MQLNAIEASGANDDLLVVLPTGYGKSLIFHTAGIVANKLTLIICPYVALIYGQIKKLQSLGIEANALGGPYSETKQLAKYDWATNADKIQFLYTTPESFVAEDTQNLLKA